MRAREAARSASEMQDSCVGTCGFRICLDFGGLTGLGFGRFRH